VSKNTKSIIRGLPKGYLSVSQINCYLQCGYTYFYRYVLGIKTAAGLPLVFGLACHHALEENAKYKLDTASDLSPDELSELYNQYFDENKSTIKDFGGKTEKTIKLEAAELLKTFHDKIASRMLAYTDGVEREVQIEVAEIPMIGFIDFVGFFDGSPAVVDYKFVGRGKSQKDVDEDIQLTFYSMATNEPDVKFLSFIKPHPTYHPLPAVKVMSGSRTEVDFTKFTNIVRRVAQAIAMRHFKPAKRGHCLCNVKYCDFWDRCPSGGCPSAPVPGRKLENKEASKGKSLVDLLEEE